MKISNIKTIIRSKFNLLGAILSAAMLIPCFSSCTDELRYPVNGDYDGEEMSVPISLTVIPIQSENPESRDIEYIEATPDETEIHDFWILEYHENGTRIGLPRYYTKSDGKELPSEIRIIVPRRDEDTYTCVLIANTNDNNLFNADNRSKFSTLDSLRTFELSTHNHEHVFNPKEHKYLLMSGWTEITTDKSTHNLEIDLMRNVCKVNVKLTSFNKEALVYKYFQWRDVPLGKAFPHGYAKYNQSISRDWRQHQDDDPDEDLKYDDLCKGIDFYIPCNTWLPEGPGSTLAETERHEDPTHFVIVARELLGIDENDDFIESGEQYEFCLYPSKDIDKQFDFLPNHCYHFEMAINGLPNYEDNDFVNLIEYTYLPESNCYMMKRDSKEIFAISISRINKYLHHFGDESEKMTDDTEWVAEVIWQDSPLPIFEFTSFRRFQAAKDKSRLEAKGTTYYKLDGTTVENMVPYLWDENFDEVEDLPMCFAFRTTGSGEGNVVVGVRRRDPNGEPTDIPVDKREYLWSWHFWITDYDPTAYEYGFDWIIKDVPGGQVHRYPGAGEVMDDWACVMDRNLGATKTLKTRGEAMEFLEDVGKNGNWENRMSEAINTFGLYYQYGRKDPFPYPGQPVYNIKGKEIEKFSGSPNMIISEPHEAVPKVPTGSVTAGRKAPRIGNDYDSYTGYDPYPVRLATKYPYKFFACAADVKMGDLEAWSPHDGEDKRYMLQTKSSWTGDTLGMSNWMNPGIETYSGKSFFDPCPIGWVMPDTNSFFGEVSTDTQVDYLESIYSTAANGLAEYYTGTLLLFDLNVPDEFAYFPAAGSRDGATGKGPEGNIWKVGTRPSPRDPEIDIPVALTNYIWTIGRSSVSMGVTSYDFCVRKESSLGVPIRCMREFPMF